ncbi:MAG TPA: sulfite exporter TauE/SafE family protein [Candidatus Angelobacter sp.]|nr:sulfite exporter TauE/SafE family protein [Candidatus Angelobacter sp.]
MRASEILLLFSATVLAGAINSVAGGGSFISFPCLLFTGMPPISANATNTMAIWPGVIAATGAYRKALTWKILKPLMPLIVISFFGSILGAALLLKTPQQTFLKLIPWLLLSATILFALGGKITAWVNRRPRSGPSAWTMVAITAVQLCVAIYFGYFGAGGGFVILALLALMGMDDIHAMNGVKTLLAACSNGVAVVIFIFAHAIVWPQAILMMAGAILGGYAGAYFAQKLPAKAVRAMVIGIGISATVYFFWQTLKA